MSNTNQDTAADTRPVCHRGSCSTLAVARWHDGMWTAEALCFEHITESLDARDKLPIYKDEITTDANLTTIGNGRNATQVVAAGAQPFAGPWACVRSVEALAHWIDQHDTTVTNSQRVAP